MTAQLPTDLPIKLFKTEAAWETWLAAHGDQAGVWLKIAKKDTGARSVSYSQALDVALCHGWIDGLKRSCDARYFLQRFTPRKAKSLWSKLNVARVEKLVAAGRMQAAGLREVDAAKADGRWDAAYQAASVMEVPPELAAALAKNAKARKAFDALDRTNRYAFCWRVHTSKKPETKAARVEKFIGMLERGERIHG
ncbi:YdeI/OmpD-associated family protein [Lysobacter auxotrophicus]|uniref:YdeI/OmpD-associated family protein n=1 Tax=Lysobacter auxotrophicus TaxID=2992573 RepID=A0ABN6ULE0_9GAMM|nr:YdeI/OmpD-associated family protein [Lysobacter auxotrophicus]BDU17132.1 YdeI/OmpD-associated family protein [Lysobacter auxotrophicus]